MYIFYPTQMPPNNNNNNSGKSTSSVCICIGLCMCDKIQKYASVCVLEGGIICMVKVHLRERLTVYIIFFFFDILLRKLDVCLLIHMMAWRNE